MFTNDLKVLINFSGGSAMKKIFDETYIATHCHGCAPKVSSFTDLNIALVICNEKYHIFFIIN